MTIEVKKIFFNRKGAKKIMKFNTIYKNGKPDYFFIKLDNEKEFNFLQPYFLTTSIDHTRHGRIKDMFPIFSGSVFAGKQIHGYGYSASADVYGELITIIKKLYGKQLSENAINELNKINTHNDNIELSTEILKELRELNNAEILKRG